MITSPVLVVFASVAGGSEPPGAFAPAAFFFLATELFRSFWPSYIQLAEGHSAYMRPPLSLRATAIQRPRKLFTRSHRIIIHGERLSEAVSSHYQETLTTSSVQRRPGVHIDKTIENLAAGEQRIVVARVRSSERPRAHCP